MAKILSIEDDEFLRELIGAHLRNAGHQVVTCADGAEAIRSILAERPDLVLLDLNMPYLDGFELLKALRGDALTRELPVIEVVVFMKMIGSVGICAPVSRAWST